MTQPGPHKTSAELEMDLGQFERARLILLKGEHTVQTVCLFMAVYTCHDTVILSMYSAHGRKL